MSDGYFAAAARRLIISLFATFSAGVPVHILYGRSIAYLQDVSHALLLADVPGLVRRGLDHWPLVRKFYMVGAAKKLDENQITLIQKLAARLAHQLETQGDQREITASRAIDMLKVVIKHNPDMTIKDTINFLTVIEGRPIDESGKQSLIKYDLLDASGVMTKRAREFQSELDLDQGIFKRISISKEQAQVNLDNMLSELGDV